MGALALVFIAILVQLSLRTAARALASARLHQALARSEARLALGLALAELSDTAGRDDCATASATLVPGANPRWTLCEKADGTRVYLLSALPVPGASGSDSVELAPADSDALLPAVLAPVEREYDAYGTLLARTAWWVSDEGVKAPVAESDWRTEASLYAGDADPEAARLALSSQLPGPCDAKALPAALATRVSSFTLVNVLDGGLREDLSALPEDGSAAFAHALPERRTAFLSTRYPLGKAVATSSASPRLEPVITEFSLTCGLAANADAYKAYDVSSNLDIVLSWFVFVEVWNPYARPLAYGGKSPDIRVVVKNLPTILATAAGGAPTLALPDPMTVDLDCHADLPQGEVQLLAEPASGGGTNGTGAWQLKVGSIRVNKFTYNEAVALHFSSASPVVEFYDLNAPSAPFFTLKLDHYGAFDIACGPGNSFFRSASNLTSYGMGREAMNAGGWGFSWHMRLKDDDLPKLFEGCDLCAESAEVDAGSGGDEYHEVLAHPNLYDRSTLIRAGDFFATLYSTPPYGNRQALLCDLPAYPVLSLAALPAGIPGADPGSDESLLEPDRYYFSGLGISTWNGSGLLPNGRLRTAERGASVAGSPSDAAGLLLSGGWNLNSADPRVWTAVIRSLRVNGFDVRGPSGSAASVDLAAPVFSLPFSAGNAASDAAASAILSGDTAPLDCTAKSPYADREHPAYLTGVRDLGPQAEALGEAIASRMAARGRPFRSLAEFAQSGLLDEAVDAVPELNRRSGDTDGIPAGAPAHLSGRRLYFALSPILFTRSDTFRIRFYGRDESSGAEAVGEALVQRLPNAAEGAGKETRRPFRVLFVRWLSRDER